MNGRCHHIRTGLLLPVLALALAWPTNARAQQAEVYVQVDSVLVGDRFDLTIVLGHDGSQDVVFPHMLIPDSLRATTFFGLGDFEILGVKQSGERAYGSAGRLDSVVYEAVTFALDSARVAGIPINLVSGPDTMTVLSNALLLPVGSLVPDGTEDIQDITDIAEFPRALWPWILAILLILATLAAWWWYRRIQATELEPRSVAPPVPAIQTALERLRQLEDVDLRALSDVKSFYVELADVLRTYFGQRANVPALEATTRELVEQLSRLRADRPVPRSLIKTLHEILDQSDLVKFADIHPVVDRTRMILKQSRETIEQTEKAYREEEAREAMDVIPDESLTETA